MSTEFDASIENCFGDLPDPRVRGRYDHKLLDIIMIAICGVLCGADSWVGSEAKTMTEKIALMTHFADVNDPRHDQGKRHLLSDILPLTICAVLSGANTWVEIEEYGESKRDWQHF